MSNKFDHDLDRNDANFRPLTPIHFLLRAATVFPERIAVIHGEQRFTWRQHAERCRRLASALMRLGVGRGDTVAALLPNIPAMLELQFGVPMTGGVLANVNIRLDAAGIALILEHSEAKVLIVDRQFSESAGKALELCRGNDVVVIDVDDPLADERGPLLGIDYEAFLASGDPSQPIEWPRDEWDAIALNYTSGTTASPKGVVYHHRGGYLNALGQIFNAQMTGHPVYLWILPLFHCNGWCQAWSIAALGGTHVCMRKVTGEIALELIVRYSVTHFSAAPAIVSMIVEAAKGRPRLDKTVQVITAGAAPPVSVLAGGAAIGLRLTHVYGMTEMHGVTTLCEWNDDWNTLSPDLQAGKLARQGVHSIVLDDMMVADPATLVPVPKDGATIGEVFMRGNLTMKGYLKNPRGTAEALAGGWYHTGDLAVIHADGYMEIKDRLKDIIISGGENISSIEVEEVLYRHPAVSSVAVVALRDPKWGEVPCAFVELRPECGEAPTEEAMIAFVRDNLAHFKCPRRIVFGPLSRTATGKIQKFALRKQAESTFQPAAQPVAHA